MSAPHHNEFLNQIWILRTALADCYSGVTCTGLTPAMPACPGRSCRRVTFLRSLARDHAAPFGRKFAPAENGACCVQTWTPSGSAHGSAMSKRSSPWQIGCSTPGRK